MKRLDLCSFLKLSAILLPLFILTNKTLSAEPVTLLSAEKIALSKDWTFTPDQGESKPIQVGKSLASQGYPPPTNGVYKVSFIYPNEPISPPQGIYLNRIQEADKIFLNGYMIGQTGKFPPNESYSPNWYLKRLYYLPDSLLKRGELNTIEIKIYYQNPTFQGGLFRSIPEIGNYLILETNILKEDGRDFCMIMVFFGIGSYQIFSIILRRQPRTNFFLLCSSLCFVLWRIPLLNITHNYSGLEFSSLLKIFFIFQTLLPIALLLFSYSLFNDPIRLKETILIFSNISIAFFQVFDIEFSSRILLLRVWEFSLLFSVWFVLLGVFRAAKQKKSEAAFLGLGFLAISVSGIIDIIIDVTTGQNIYLTQYGFLFLMILSAMTISLRNAKNEKELLVLTKELETRVQIRTEELRLKNNYLEQDLYFASQLQGHLLPTDSPSVRGLTLFPTYLPMEQVGGDLYDWVEVSDHQLLFLIADVAGHGVPAALVSSMVKVQFREISKETHDPATVLFKMNQSLVKLVSKYFITASCALFDTEKNQVILSSGGHPIPLVFNRYDSRFNFINLKGSILGWKESFTYQNVTEKIQVGDRYFFYTDGVTEARSEGKLFGEPNLMAIIKNSKDDNIQKLSETIRQKIIKYSNEDLKDDVTFVVIEII